MNTVTLADLALLVPELILVIAACALLLVARRVQTSNVAMGVTLMAALAAALQTLPDPGQPHAISEGFGGMFVVDTYARYFKLLILSSLAFCSMLTLGRPTDQGIPRAEQHVLLLLATTGMMLAASAGDLFTLYLGLELTTLAAYVLVGIRTDRPRSNEAALKYFLLGSFASAILLFGLSMTYGITGGTELSVIADAFAGTTAGPLHLIAVALVIAGLAFKIGAAPFHAWAPDAYQGSSAPVAAFLAAGSKAAGLAALGRICLVAFGTQAEVWSTLFALLAGLSILVGSVLALAQSDLKRLLAYSSIAHAGYALLGLVSGTPDGVSATMTYTAFYVFMTLGAFGVVSGLGQRGENVEGYRGLSTQRPAVAAVMLLFLLSLTGIPPTAGFAAKFVVISSAVQSGHVALAVLAVLCSVLTAFIYMRIAVLMYMHEPESDAPPGLHIAVSTALALAALVTMAGGLFPGALSAWTLTP